MTANSSSGPFYKNRKILVAGGTGLIGIPLVRQLLELGAAVTVAALEPVDRALALFGDKITYFQRDLTDMATCLELTKDKDFVFNLVGIRGSVGIGQTKAASFLVPMLNFQTNLMEAAFRNAVDRFLFVSSVCAYPQSKLEKTEDTLWDGMPMQNDRIPGIAKRIGEIQGEAYMLEHGWDAVRVVRPSNVFGPHDDFNPATAQVISALIHRAISGENPLTVWGDGSAVRDFMYSEDVAYWMIRALQELPPCTPVNLGSGQGTDIRTLVALISDCLEEKPEVIWDSNAPTGDPVRVLSMDAAKQHLGYELRTPLSDAIAKTMAWYKEQPSNGPGNGGNG